MNKQFSSGAKLIVNCSGFKSKIYSDKGILENSLFKFKLLFSIYIFSLFNLLDISSKLFRLLLTILLL